MTKLTIYAEWTTFILDNVVLLFALLASMGFAYFGQTTALGIVAGILALKQYVPTFVHNAQDFAAKLEVLRK